MDPEEAGQFGGLVSKELKQAPIDETEENPEVIEWGSQLVEVTE